MGNILKKSYFMTFRVILHMMQKRSKKLHNE